jgi:hypothetical protein
MVTNGSKKPAAFLLRPVSGDNPYHRKHVKTYLVVTDYLQGTEDIVQCTLDTYANGYVQH